MSLVDKLARLLLIKEGYYASVAYRSLDIAASIFRKCSDHCTAHDVCLDNYLSGDVIEFGTGKIASMSHVFSILGASSVTTVDVSDQYQAKATEFAIRNTKVAHRILEGLNGSIKQEALIQNLFNSIASPDILRNKNICYMAPLSNLEMCKLGQFDFQFSYTVIEHIPETDLPGFFDALKQTLKDGGLSIHYIDFYDHNSGVADPFGHLKKNKPRPKSFENSCGVSLATILLIAEKAGLGLVFCDNTTLTEGWESLLEKQEIASAYLSNAGIVSSVVGFKKL